MLATAIRAAMFGSMALAGAIAPAVAEKLRLRADLLPVAGTTSKAAGDLVAHYDTDGNKFTWRGTYRGLGTYAISANFQGAPGSEHRDSVAIRTIDSPFEGTAILSDKQAKGLLASEWSIVIRTAAFPEGELLGQIVRGH